MANKDIQRPGPKSRTHTAPYFLGWLEICVVGIWSLWMLDQRKKNTTPQSLDETNGRCCRCCCCYPSTPAFSLVGGWATLLKNMNVNWDDDIPKSHGKVKNGNQTTNHFQIPSPASRISFSSLAMHGGITSRLYLGQVWFSH